VTSAEIAEMMAFERLEPFGGLQEDFRAGQICALTANVNRDPKKHGPFNAGHFMPALERALASSSEPILLDDPEEQSKLLMTLFGVQGAPGA
jgi:hypothetical protein